MPLVYQAFMNWSAECPQIGNEPFHISIGYAVARDARCGRPALPSVVSFECHADQDSEEQQSDHLRPTDLKKV
jgi:hypothetical protein